MIYAVQNKIPYGSVKNASGAFVKASLESVTAAAGSVKTMPADFRVSITNAPGKDAYPISSFTWLLIPLQSKDAARGKIISDFLNWMVDDGQKMTAALTYAPLPTNVAEKVKAEIKQVGRCIGSHLPYCPRTRGRVLWLRCRNLLQGLLRLRATRNFESVVSQQILMASVFRNSRNALATAAFFDDRKRHRLVRSADNPYSEPV